MVAWMTYMANPKSSDKILEIGTGSGFQSAILAYFRSNVYSIEIVKPLGEDAKRVHKKHGYSDKIKVKVADGYFGWKKYAPFDKILVTCGTNHIPPALVRQLARGGTMIIPVGNPYGKQRMIVLRKDKRGRIKTRAYFADHFVPMTGKALQKYKSSRK
jgi:protein-L-isoaspartate(D-aspartate) O-methyltransferase